MNKFRKLLISLALVLGLGGAFAVTGASPASANPSGACLNLAMQGPIGTICMANLNTGYGLYRPFIKINSTTVTSGADAIIVNGGVGDMNGYGFFGPLYITSSTAPACTNSPVGGQAKYGSGVQICHGSAMASGRGFVYGTSSIGNPVYQVN